MIPRPPPVMWRGLREGRASAFWAAVGTFGFALFDCLFYPSYRDAFADIELPDAYAGFVGELGSITTPAGFLAAEYFSWIPVLLAAFAIVLGGAATAGEEGGGTLDLLLAQPISRVRLLLEKVAAHALLLTLAGAAALPAFAIGMPIGDLDIGAGRVIAATALMIAVTLVFLALTTMLGALLPSRRAASTTATAVLVVTYFLNLFGAAVESLHGARRLSPFYWGDGAHALAQGLPVERLAGLLLVSAALLALAVVAFEARQIGAVRLPLHLLRRSRRTAAA